MHRRQFLELTGYGFALSTALAAGMHSRAYATQGKAAKMCYAPASSNTPTVKWEPKAPPYRIAVSNSYIGNSWRTEMMKIAKAYAHKPEVAKHIAKFREGSAGNSVSQQAAEINQLVLAGFDAIVVDAANPTGLNSTIDHAVKAGVLVVSFDNVVTTDKAVIVDEDQYEMGKRRAQFVAKQLKGKGTVLLVRGVEGTSVDAAHAKAAHDVFKHHPNIKVTQVIGKWDNATAQKVTKNALATQTVDGVVSGGGDTGIVRAFLQSGQTMVPIAGEADNGLRRLAAKHQFPMMSIGNSPAEAAVALQVAIDILRGHRLPRSINLPLPTVTTDSLKAGVNYFPDQPDSFYTDFNIPGCHTKLSLKEIQQQSV